MVASDISFCQQIAWNVFLLKCVHCTQQYRSVVAAPALNDLRLITNN